MAARFRKRWLIVAGAALYTLLAYPLYQLWGHRLIAAIHQGRLKPLLSFRGSAYLPLSNYTELADHIFLDYLWLTPLGTVLAWLGLWRLARWLLAQVPPEAPAPASRPWRHDYLLAGLVYLAATLAAYHYILPRFGQDILGPPRDNLKYIWTLWWSQQVLSHPGASFYFSKAIFFPQGASLLYNDYSWYNIILSWGLSPFLRPAAVYNVLILQSFPLAALGAFALARQVTGHSLASLVAGLIFAFTPSHYAHAALHMNISAIQFLPWFVLYLIKALRSKGWTQAWGAGAFLLLNALCDWYYLIFCLMFMGLAYGYLAWRRGRLFMGDVLARLALMLGLTFLALSPWVVPMMLVALKHPGVYMGGHFDYVSDLAGLFIPADFQWVSALVPRWLLAANRAYTGNSIEVASYLGLVNLGLLAYALAKIRGRAAKYLLGLGAMLLLALGPLPHLWGHSLPVALPWLPLVKLPFVSNVRNPARSMVLAYLFLALIAALALEHYLRQRQDSPRAQALVCLLGLLIFCDFYSPPLHSTPIVLPPAYAHLETGGDWGVLDLPGGPQSNKHRYMVYATMHGHPIVQGALPRQVGTSLKDHLEYRDLDRQKKQLIDNRVKYVVIHKRLIDAYDDKRAYSEPNIRNIEEYLRTYQKVYEDQGQLLLKVY